MPLVVLELAEFGKATNALCAGSLFSPSFAFKQEEKKAKFCSRFDALTGRIVVLIRSRLLPCKESDVKRSGTTFHRGEKQRKPDKHTSRFFLLSFPVFKIFLYGTNFERNHVGQGDKGASLTI
jgi:hypothetical protein